MKKHLLTLTFGICSTMLAFTACKKDKDAEPSNSKTITCLPDTANVKGLGKIVMTYNAQRQLIKYGNLSESNTYTLYSYSGNKISEVNYTDGNVDKEADYILNSNGYVDYSYVKEYYSNSVYYDTTNYVYNTEGRLILELSGKDSVIYTYQDGNLASMKSVKEDGIRFSTFTYTTIENKQNIFENQLLIPGLFGKSNKNLVEKEVEAKPTKEIYTTTYNYQVNADGYITKSSFIVMSSSDPSVPYYTWEAGLSYDCK